VSHEDCIKVDGVVSALCGHGLFKVSVKGHDITCKRSGRLDRFRIQVVLGDRVTIEMSPYDLNHGRIIQREQGKKIL
jgi:translation initiation factor IF-1